MTVLVTGGPAGDEVTIKLGKLREVAAPGPNETRRVVLEAPPAFPYKDMFVHTLRLRSTRGGAARIPEGREERVLGAFLRISLEVDKRPTPRP
jgi:hypothetical protein